MIPAHQNPNQFISPNPIPNKGPPLSLLFENFHPLNNPYIQQLMSRGPPRPPTAQKSKPSRINTINTAPPHTIPSPPASDRPSTCFTRQIPAVPVVQQLHPSAATPTPAILRSHPYKRPTPRGAQVSSATHSPASSWSGSSPSQSGFSPTHSPPTHSAFGPLLVPEIREVALPGCIDHKPSNNNTPLPSLRLDDSSLLLAASPTRDDAMVECGSSSSECTPSAWTPETPQTCTDPSSPTTISLSPAATATTTTTANMSSPFSLSSSSPSSLLSSADEQSPQLQQPNAPSREPSSIRRDSNPDNFNDYLSNMFSNFPDSDHGSSSATVAIPMPSFATETTKKPKLSKQIKISIVLNEYSLEAALSPEKRNLLAGSHAILLMFSFADKSSLDHLRSVFSMDNDTLLSTGGGQPSPEPETPPHDSDDTRCAPLPLITGENQNRNENDCSSSSLPGEANSDEGSLAPELDMGGALREMKRDGTPFFVIGNKSDLRKKTKQISLLDAASFSLAMFPQRSQRLSPLCQPSPSPQPASEQCEEDQCASRQPSPQGSQNPSPIPGRRPSSAKSLVESQKSIPAPSTTSPITKSPFRSGKMFALSCKRTKDVHECLQSFVLDIMAAGGGSREVTEDGEEEVHISLAVVGPRQVGKSSLCNQFAFSFFADQYPTSPRVYRMYRRDIRIDRTPKQGLFSGLSSPRQKSEGNPRGFFRTLFSKIMFCSNQK